MSKNRAIGSFLGLACGDALGRPVEFKTPQQIQNEYGMIKNMEANGTYNKPAGTITDDTEQALAIARSIVDKNSFDTSDIAKRFVEWYESGPFDIGITTRSSLQRLKNGEPIDQASMDVLSNSGPNSGAGNGSVMRCPPIAIAFSNQTEKLVQASEYSSIITHADERCVLGTSIVNLLIDGYINKRETPLKIVIEWTKQNKSNEYTTEIISLLQTALHNPKPLSELSNSGYVLDTIETSITVSTQAETFEDAVVNAVNLGGDADTIGAVTGAIAGARFGHNSIPKRWSNEINEESEIIDLSETMYHYE